MKIISWDVGIKNLAYCIINYDEDLKTKTILHWNSINLIPEAEHCYISTCKKPVIKLCTYYGKNVCWCEKHEKFYNTLATVAKNDITILSKPVCVKTINCNNINVDDLRKNMIHKLDMVVLPLMYSEKVEISLIENQPAMRNPRMKAIADTLYTWFLIRCVLDSRITKSIHLISPSNKLKQYAGELMNSENKYKTTKLKSIEVVTTLFDSTSEWTIHLNKFTKKDDLCDSLLQGFYWIDKEINQSNKNALKAEKKAAKKTPKEKAAKKTPKEKVIKVKSIKTSKNNKPLEI